MDREPGKNKKRGSREMTIEQTTNTPNHGEVFAAASIVSAFFDVAYEMVIAKGQREKWGVNDKDRTQAASTLANACAVVYVAQMAERQRKTKKPAP